MHLQMAKHKSNYWPSLGNRKDDLLIKMIRGTAAVATSSGSMGGGMSMPMLSMGALVSGR